MYARRDELGRRKQPCSHSRWQVQQPGLLQASRHHLLQARGAHSQNSCRARCGRGSAACLCGLVSIRSHDSRREKQRRVLGDRRDEHCSASMKSSKNGHRRKMHEGHVLHEGYEVMCSCTRGEPVHEQSASCSSGAEGASSRRRCSRASALNVHARASATASEGKEATSSQRVQGSKPSLRSGRSRRISVRRSVNQL